MRFDLTDKEWAVLEPLLPPVRQGGARRDDRQVLNGIFYVLRTGVPWDDLPARYGPPGTVYNRFNRWAQQGIWRRMYEALEAALPQSVEMIDSTSIKAHRAAAGAEKGG
ncbi:transposase [Parvularcula dongshanensis]|uniref:Transposase n=1 Tax=Parvularcula dongshanensis TaxID=1173995 RepID=A0A840I019_9PROT|nr:transposase [Parvularcula dongshanensis]